MDDIEQYMSTLPEGTRVILICNPIRVRSEVAEVMCGLTTDTLSKARMNGVGPKFQVDHNEGSQRYTVYYMVDDLWAYYGAKPRFTSTVEVFQHLRLSPRRAS